MASGVVTILAVDEASDVSAALGVLAREHGGRLVDGHGVPAVAFDRVSDALQAAAVLGAVTGSDGRRAALASAELASRGADPYGPAVGRAVAILAVAEQGEVLLSRPTASLAAEITLAGISIGPFEERGAARVVAPLVASPSASRLDETGPAKDQEAPARSSSEVERLLSLWRNASSGRTCLALVSGEAGSGKTELLADFVQRLPSGCVVIEGACDPDVGIPYHPLVEHLGDAIGQLADEDLDRLGPQRCHQLARIVPQLVWRRPDLAPGPDPDADRLELFDAIAMAVATVAHRRPVAIVVDDLQWIDAPTALLLGHLVNALVFEPVLIVVGHRPSAVATVGVAPALLRRLSQRADVLELELGPGVTEDSITTTLGGTALGVIELCAVAGPRASVDLIAAVLALEPAVVHEALRESVDTGLLVVRDGWVSFPHSNLRSSILAALDPAARTRLHGLVGQALEAMPAGARPVEALAHHFAESSIRGDAHKAARYGLAAAERALGRLAYEDAISHALRALSSLVATSAEDHALRADLEMVAGWAHEHSGGGPCAEGWQAALDAMREALDACDARRVARAANLAFNTINFGTSAEPAIVLLEEAMVLFSESSSEERAAVLSAYVVMMGGSPRAQSLAREAVALSRAGHDDEVSLMALRSLAAAFTGSNDVAPRLAALDETRVILGDRVDRRWMFDWSYRGAALLQTGDLDGYRAEAARAEAIAARTGWWDTRYLAMAFRAVDDLLHGKAAEVRDRMTRLVSEAPPSSRVMWVSLAADFVARRDLGLAGELEPTLRALVASNPEPLVLTAGLAVLLAEAGAPDAAEVLANGVDRLGPIDRSDLWLPAAGLLADAAALTGDRIVALRLLPWLEPYAGQWLVGGYGTMCVGSVDRVLGAMLVAAGRADEAETVLARAAARAERLGALPERGRALAWLSVVPGGPGPAAAAEATAIAERLTLPGLTTYLTRAQAFVR